MLHEILFKLYNGLITAKGCGVKVLDVGARDYLEISVDHTVFVGEAEKCR